MKLTTDASVPVYTIAGSSTARPLPEWLQRQRRRSLKKDPEYANRVELLQDFEFEEASACVRVSEDGQWVMSTGTYKPQMHVHYLPHLALSYARHTDSLNQTFVLLSSDYSKSLHLQADRSLEFHTPGGLHYTTRIPRYGRDLAYHRWTAEALVPSVGLNADGYGEVFRLNLEVGRFMKGFDVEVGSEDADGVESGGLQGGVNAGAVNCVSVAEESHGLLAFGTSIGTVEFWDTRSRNRVSTLNTPHTSLGKASSSKPEITALEFHRSGLRLASGDSDGLIHIYDLRSPVPLMRKDQGYGGRIKTLKYLLPSSRSSSTSSEKLMGADSRCVKIWNASSGDYWTSVEPSVDLNHVEWVPDSGMILTANEGRQQHAFFIPQLGPAPRWCGFLDNIVEEMADDADDPNAFSNTSNAGEVYANYKFLDLKQLREHSLDHLIGQTNLLRPYMHGYFVAQSLYEQARSLTNPDLAEQQRQKSIKEKIDKERESRIRGNKTVAVKVNRKLAEKLAAREEANERRKAQRLLRKGDNVAEAQEETGETQSKNLANSVVTDDRFKRLFEDNDFEIDETSREFQLHNPSSVPATTSNGSSKRRGLTAVEEDELMGDRKSSDDEDDEDDDVDEDEDEQAELTALRARARDRDDIDEYSQTRRIGNASYQKSGHKSRQGLSRSNLEMRVSSTKNISQKNQQRRNKSFGDLVRSAPERDAIARQESNRGGVVGEKQVTFAPSKPQKKNQPVLSEKDGSSNGRSFKDRRSASGNTFRRM